MKNRPGQDFAARDGSPRESRERATPRGVIPRESGCNVSRVRLLFALVLLFGLASGVCQEQSPAATAPGAVSESTLEARIAEVEAAAGIEEQAKTKLLELYRKALGHLRTARSNAQAAEGFRQTAEMAPARLQEIREAMAESASSPPEDTLEVDSSTPLRQLEQLLQKEKADLAAVEAKRSDLEKRLGEEAGRPARIQQRLIDAGEEQEDVAARINLPLPPGEGPETAEARRWALQTRFDAISSEIKMLDQELLSQSARLELMQAELDRAAASVQWVGTRARVLESLVNRKRQADAEKAKSKAEAIRQGAAGEGPVVIRLADENAALSAELAKMSGRLEALTEQADETARLARQIETSFRRTREAVEIGRLTQELGHKLRRHRRNLPDMRSYRRAAKEREAVAAEIGVRRLDHLEEQAKLGDLDAYLSAILAEAGSEDTRTPREQLSGLAEDRRELLETVIAADDVYLAKLAELELAQRRLLDAIQDFSAFLDENLLWVRSRSLIELFRSEAAGDRGGPLFSVASWGEVAGVLAYQARNSPVFVLLGVGLLVLAWGRGRLRAAIRESGARLGKPTTDRFGYTAHAVVLTLAAAAAWPLAMAVTGWQLMVSVEETAFTGAMGASLLAMSVHFFYLRAFSIACIPGGLAAAHFRWPDSSLRTLRANLNRLTWIFIPSALLSMIASTLDPLDVTWASGRLFFLVAVGSVAFAFYGLLHPRSGVLAGYLRRRQRTTFGQLYRLAYPLLVAYPLALGVLSLVGYRYSAGFLANLLLETAWFTVALVFVSALAERWLLVTRRRLAYEAAMERRDAKAKERRAESAPRGGDDGSAQEGEEPEVDVVALSDKSLKLINTALLFFALFGLWIIWSDVVPALRILDKVTLWHHTVKVDGQDQVLPVTLASLGLALIYAVITIVLAKQLPAVLEIILLQHTEMSVGSRYTVTTLTNYAIVTIGLVSVFKTIGADWSQLQWLVAALGVGIGFGLQEIVANFISGIIILFERPIRIGDVVTVGDTDGTVTRIRSRATTIRSWDGKELLVPNKEFITGRLLNWSLSDQATRIVLSVGIAYGSDVRRAMRLLEEVARENENVLEDPPPSVIFETFGDNSLGLLLRCFVDSVDVRYPTMSTLNEAINDKFNAAGIVIAFPQRDLHLDTIRPLQVELRRARETPRDPMQGGTGEGCSQPE